MHGLFAGKIGARLVFVGLVGEGRSAHESAGCFFEFHEPIPRMSSTQSSSESYLVLKDQEPFAIGGRRKCFVHPLDPHKCVKVLRDDELRTIRSPRSSSIIPASWRRKYDNNADELRELTVLEKRLGASLMGRHLPRCYGMTMTDEGPGLVLDLVRDADGKISRTIREWITLGMELELLRPAFDEFCQFLSDHLVLTRSLLDHNLAVCVGADGPERLVMIDGFGYPAWLPLAAWIPPLGRAKIAKKKAIAWKRYEELVAAGGVSEEVRRNSTWDQGHLRHRG
jgi:hypothetical protein